MKELILPNVTEVLVFDKRLTTRPKLKNTKAMFPTATFSTCLTVYERNSGTKFSYTLLFYVITLKRQMSLN